MSKRTAAAFVTLAVLTVCSLVGADAGSLPERPNILFIVADDLGWADVGYHGSRIKTPNVDRLAREGVELDQHYVYPTCSPTRAAFLSGRYATRFGISSPTNTQAFPFGTPTLASILKEAGYFTGVTGKWHLGSKPEWGPLKFGFTASYGALAGGVNQWTHHYKVGEFSKTWHRNDEYVEEEGHSTDLIAREAIRWIEAEKDRPFFIYVAFTAVHTPIQVPEKWIEPYAGAHFYDEPEMDRDYRRFAAYTSHMDAAVGKMVETVERTGRRERTLIVFLSDNGSYPSWTNRNLYPGEVEDSVVLGSNLPLRGFKKELYEGGVRTPALANWPGVLEPSKVEVPLHICDWTPTLTQLTGVLEEPNPEWDGHNIWPFLTGERTTAQPRTMYWAHHEGRAVRKGDWKLIRGEDGIEEMFDLANDPLETTNLVTEKPKRLADLRTLMDEQMKLDMKGS